jgi:hypothetical protein
MPCLKAAGAVKAFVRLRRFEPVGYFDLHTAITWSGEPRFPSSKVKLSAIRLASVW